MHHPNRSVPSLPSQQPQFERENDPQVGVARDPPPPFDPTASLDTFSALTLHDPTQRQIPPMHRSPDPVPRAASSLSHRSAPALRGIPPPRHAATLPQSQQYPQEFPPGPPGAHAALHDDQRSLYSYDSGSTGYSSLQSAVPHDRNYPPNWQAPMKPAEYNPLYAAASDVLGMGPPPGSIPSPRGPPNPVGPGQPLEYSAYPSVLAPVPPNHGNSFNHPRSSYPQSYESFPPSQTPSIPPSEGHEIEPRPSLERTGTFTSNTPSANKSRAIDLTTPPYTKEYIEQYRQRIKGDPDPEAHFLYAKYLIEAAKKIRAGAQDQRAAKKYSEMLIQESLKVIKRLATQGEAYHEAQFFLANCHGTGALGLQVDHERAYHLYLQAAKQNHAAASYRVAVCNEIGAGTRKEPQRAAAFYRKAASLGDTPAMYKLGMILLQGSLEQQKNPREAITWLKRAAEQADEDNPHALHELGLLHEQPNSTLVPYDPTYAKALFTQAAQLGYTQSQYKLGQCYEYGALGCAVDPRRSIAWYTKAAEKGDAEAELALSGWYLTGSEGVLKQSDSEAYLWARRAANKGLSKAEYAVGYYAEVGIGIKQDIEFAKKWYMRAAGTNVSFFISLTLICFFFSPGK